MTDNLTILVGQKPSAAEVVADLRRAAAVFQLRAIATHMGVPADKVRLSLRDHLLREGGSA